MTGDRIRFWKVLVLCVACPAILALAAALLCSKVYWGYFIRRPGLSRRVAAASTYVSVTAFHSVPGGGESATGLVKDGDSPEKLLSLVRKDRYEFGFLDVVEVVANHGPLNAFPAMPEDRLSRVFAALKAPGVLERPDPGYENHQFLNGVAVEAKSVEGTDLLFLGVHGGEVSNDHHPNYRFVFEDVPGQGYRLVESNRYFTDFAGIEGAEWPVLLLTFLLPSYAVGVPVLVLLPRLTRRRRRNLEV